MAGKRLLAGMVALAAVVASGAAIAQETVKIGLLLPLTGPFASTGKQVEAGARVYMQQHGDTVAGKKIELIVKDDTGSADVTKRLAQELVVNDKVAFLAGFGLTPLALATAPIATQAKVPLIVMAAGTSIITEKSPYIARTSVTLPQTTVPMAEWAKKNGINSVIVLVADYAPGLDAAKAFADRFGKLGGKVVDELRAPVRNPDFAPFLQRIKDTKPDAVFVFVPSGAGSAVMKQFVERGLAQDGIRLIGTGEITDDDVLEQIGDAALGTVTAHHFSAAHNSPENKAFVADFQKANNGLRPNFMGVGGYDGMALIYKAMEKTKGSTDGDALIAAMKGMSWMSPRGPISIDPETRDIIENIYIRKVEKVDGHLYNIEFATFEAVKDPVKAGM